MVAAFLMRSGSEFRTDGPNERMHSHLPSRTYKVGVAGDRCQHRSKVIKKESTPAGDQRDRREWKWR